MLNADGAPAYQAAFARSPRDITHVSFLSDSRKMFQQVKFSSRSMTMELLHEEKAKSNPRHLMQLRKAYMGQDVRLDHSVLVYRQASRRSALGRCVPAEAFDIERDAGDLLYQRGIRRVPRNWVKVYSPSGDEVGNRDKMSPA